MFYRFCNASSSSSRNHRRGKQGGSRGWCPPCLEELYVAINLTRKEPEARWASAELGRLRSTLRILIQPLQYYFSDRIIDHNLEPSPFLIMWAPLAEGAPCAQEKLANWEMASKQRTLGVFFSLSKSLLEIQENLRPVQNLLILRECIRVSVRNTQRLCLGLNFRLNI